MRKKLTTFFGAATGRQPFNVAAMGRDPSFIESDQLLV